jgi:hypothetical protein
MTRILRRHTYLMVAAVLAGLVTLALPSITLQAQTALYTTTLGAALAQPGGSGGPATQITLASGTNVAAGQGLTVDNEYMTIQSATSTTTLWNVVRGQSGTRAGAHASGAPVFFGATSNFSFNSQQPVGPCTSTLEQATPRVVVSTGVSVYLCPAVSTYTGSTAATWAPILINGFPGGSNYRYTGWTYTSAGAVTIQPGVQFIGSGGALAMTLADPSKYMDGMVMVLQASTAQAHTVTYTAGFYGNTTSSDVATFGGAIGDNFVIYASNGAWRVQSLKSVTLG